jgi:hypothetical protein
VEVEGLLNFILHSQNVTSFEGVTYSQVSVIIILCFSRYSTCIILRNYKFMTMFLPLLIYLFNYLVINGNMEISLSPL